jgi:hypothetical protein
MPGTGADRSLQEVLAGSLSVQLTRRKTVFQLTNASDARTFTLANGLKQAATQNVEYLLVGTYTTTATDCSLQVDLYEVAGGKKIRSTGSSGRINLSLDSVVAQALEKALTGISFHEPSAGIAAAQQGETPSEAISPAIEAAPVQVPVNPATGEANHAPEPFWRLLAISSGVAPLITTGAASDYAKLGLLATLALDFRFRLDSGTLAAGILSGVSWLGAKGAVSTADILIVPIGLDLQYAMNEGSFPGITLHLSGGPALMSVDADYTGTETKIVPYVLAGMTLDLPFAAFMGLAVEASYVAFIESSLLIMAFAPEVSLYVRF